MRVRYRSRQNDRLRGMLVQVHIHITPLHSPLPVFRRIGECTIPYSWRGCKQLRHLCETAYLHQCLTVLIASMFDGLVAFAVDRWPTTAARKGGGSYHGQGHQCRRQGSFWVPSVPNVRMKCEYANHHAKTIVFAGRWYKFI
ncbi:uncharacterized protein TNCV_792811 [Trichonephila clavipes]|nr:uncharacterized protein TNCV_792811 [Trichonephila clavipes]